MVLKNISLQESLDMNADIAIKGVKKRQKSIRKQTKNSKPEGPQVLRTKSRISRLGQEVGMASSRVSPNLPKRNQINIQLNTRKFGE